MEGLPGVALIGVDPRVLELDHPLPVGSHIRDVPFARLVRADYLLPPLGEAVLPCSVPVSLRLPPPVAVPG